MKNQDKKVLNTVLVGALAAMVYVVTLFRFPLLGSKVHFANAVCLLAGLLLGPNLGGVAAGLGSALYDLTMYNEGIVNLLITFVSKFAMAWVCGKIAGKREEKQPVAKVAIACVCGALTYVALYMLKTFIYQKIVYGFPMDAVWATMWAKLIPSLINAGAAVIAAPLFYHAVLPALRKAGLLKEMRN